MGLFNGDGPEAVAFGILVDPTSRGLDNATRRAIEKRVGQGAVLFGDTPRQLTDEEINELTTRVD